MNMQDEIHSIKNSLLGLQQTVNGLVRKLGNLSVLENQQENHKESVAHLSAEVDKLAGVILGLNTSIATMNGIAAGKKVMGGIFGGLITLSIVALVTTVIAHNSTLDVHSSEITAIKADIKSLRSTK